MTPDEDPLMRKLFTCERCKQLTTVVMFKFEEDETHAFCPTCFRENLNA